MGRFAGAVEESGGNTVSKPSRIPIARPDLTEHERENMQRCFDSKWLSQGPYVEFAEEKLKAITGRRYAICTSSGTSALIAALLTSKTPYSSPEIVGVPAFTFAAVHNAVKILGLTPRYFASIEESWQVDDPEVRKSDGDRCVIMAPCYGKVESSDVYQWGLVDPGKTIYIEDAAESFGGSLHGRPAGSFGRISCISFYCNKICTSIEGGAVLTDDYMLAGKLRCIVNHGIAGRNYESVMVGFNGRMTDLSASVLCAQLDRLPEMLARRRTTLASYYQAAGKNWTFPTIAEGEICAPWLFAGIPADRDAVIGRCNEANIEWRSFFPIPKEAGDMPETRKISEGGICLPLSSALTEEEIQRVCEVIYGG